MAKNAGELTEGTSIDTLSLPKVRRNRNNGDIEPRPRGARSSSWEYGYQMTHGEFIPEPEPVSKPKPKTDVKPKPEENQKLEIVKKSEAKKPVRPRKVSVSAPAENGWSEVQDISQIVSKIKSIPENSIVVVVDRDRMSHAIEMVESGFEIIRSILSKHQG